MRNIFKSTLLAFLVFFFIQGCQQNHISGLKTDKVKTELQEKSPKFFVPQELAISVAEGFANKFNFSYARLLDERVTKNKNTAQKVVENVLPLKDDDGDIALYLINYANQGFVIVSADKRENPILAYSKTKKMPDKADEPIPGGLEIWLDQNIFAIDNLENSKGKGTDDNTHSGWDAFVNENETVKYREPIDNTCPSETYTLGPLLQTEWGQDEGYNNDAPYFDCSTTANGRALTGCVATAIAQVMRYHEYPTTYNWDIMPDGNLTVEYQPYGTEEIADLMRDVGDAVHMQWGCAASGAYTQDGVDALENVFNYSSSADYQEYDISKVQDELRYNRPVILRGCDTGGGGCHAWVTDGFRETMTYSDDCSVGVGYLYFHMNWGWNGAQNAWYSFDNFNPYSYNFNDGNHQLHGIQP